MTVQEIIFVVEDDPEGGYTAHALGQAIFAEGETMEDLKANIKDALECHFDDERPASLIVRLHIVKEEKFTYAMGLRILSAYQDLMLSIKRLLAENFQFLIFKEFSSLNFLGN